MSFVHNSLIHIPLSCHYCSLYTPILLVLLYSKFRGIDDASHSSIISTSISYKYRGLLHFNHYTVQTVQSEAVMNKDTLDFQTLAGQNLPACFC